MCPRFLGQSEHQICFQFFPSTTKMLFIFQHFCVQMNLPIWFSHTRIITKHLSTMLSVIIFKILRHSSCDKCLFVGSDPQPRTVGYSSWEQTPGVLASDSLHTGLTAVVSEESEFFFNFHKYQRILLNNKMNVKNYFHGSNSAVLKMWTD